MATVRIPSPLRPYTGGKEYITAVGQTVGEVLDDLMRQFPDLRPHLFNDDKLRNFVNVFVGGEDVRYLDSLETPITDDDRLLIIPSVAGG
jgi:molybdopterin converting factor small subunit